MAYPPLPKDKQYGTWFPEIDERSVPSDEDVTTIDNTAIALHPPDGKKTMETLGPPKKIDLGVLRVWLSGGPRTSRSFDDGPSFDYKGHDIEKAKAEGDDDFNLAPGLDEKDVTINWQVYGLGKIKSAKLELFGRDNFKPLWEHHWGNAWGKKKAEISDFHNKSKAKGPTAFGEVPFSSVTLDANALPKGILNLALSPYQLRLTVSGCSDASTPPDGDKLVYPMTAWTYLHVLVESFDYKFGKAEWIDVAAEKLILEELRGFVKGKGDVEKMQADTRHYVSLPANHNKCCDGNEFTLHQQAWGDGARVPIIATVKIKTLAKSGTSDRVKDVVAGAKLLWDWGEADPKRPETLSKATPTFGDGKMSKEFFEFHLKSALDNHLPKGSFNCPKEFGGNHGDDTKPFFKGGNPLPWAATACGQRTWAVTTPFDANGETGVMLRPSRFPGDTYKVTTYLDDPSLDTRDELKDPVVASGSPGVFEVQRKTVLHHIVVGDMPGADVAGARNALVDAAKKQVDLAFDFSSSVGPTVYAGNQYAPFMKEVLKNLVQHTKFADKYHYWGLELIYLLRTGRSVAGLLNVPQRDAFQALMKACFRMAPMRIIKKDFDLGDLGKSQYVEGGGISGCVLDLEQTWEDAPIYYLLSSPTEDAFPDNAALTDPYSTKNRTAHYAKPLKSCWKLKIVHDNKDTFGKDIVIRITGCPDEKLVYKRAGASRNYASELKQDKKDQIKNAIIAGVNKHADGETLTITVIGHEGTSKTSTKRVANVMQYAAQIAPTLVIERKKVYQQFIQAGSMSYDSCFTTMSKTLWTDALTGPGNLYGFVAEAAAYTHATQNNLTEGLIFLQSSRFSTLTDYPADVLQGRLRKDDKIVDVVDYPSGGFVNKEPDANGKGLSEPAKEKLGLVTLITPDPGSATVFKPSSGKTKAPWSIMLHEVGHGFWLEHATLTRKGHPGADSPRPEQHTADSPCIMSYDAETDAFCGRCMMRLRGWDTSKLLSNYTYNKATITISLGDPDSIFNDDATTDEGKQARVQVLGLFNRPIDLMSDVYFGAEATDAWTYAWGVAQTILGAGVVNDPATTLNKAVKEFIVEGGAFPAAGKQAKLRVYGHLHPYYSNMDVAMRYGDAEKKDSLENRFKIMAIRGDIEAQFQGANPSLGTYPIDITVTDASGQPMTDTEIWVKLVPPEKPTAYDPNAAGKPLLGATTFVNGTGANPLAGGPHFDQVTAWFDKFVTKHDESGDDDPQKDNAHFEMGGKRRMYTDGDVGKPRAGIRNIFTSGASGSRTANLPMAKDAGNAPVKHAVMLKTDSQGVAQLLFTPSTVGGDKYKIEVTVREGPDKREIGKLETGTMVVWKTHRVAAYYQMPNAANTAALPPHLLHWRTRIFYNSEDKDLFLPMPVLDLRRYVGDELARAYCETLFEAEALHPTPLTPQFWADFQQAAIDYSNRYSTEFNVMYKLVNGGSKQLTVDPRNKRRYTGHLPGTLVRGQVAVGHLQQGLRLPGNRYDAQDYTATLDDLAASAPLRSIKKDDWLFGLDQANAPNDALFNQGGGMFQQEASTAEVDENLSSVNYGTNQIVVVFKNDPPIAPLEWIGGPNPAWFKTLHSVTGATEANTVGGRLWLVLSPGRSDDRMNVHVYNGYQRTKQQLVALAKNAKENTRVRCKPQNRSGITVELEIGAGLPGPMVTMLSTGIPIVMCTYFPEKILDVQNGVDTTIAASPWLLNLLPAEEYNRRHGPQFPDADIPISSALTAWEEVVGGGIAFSWAETIFMRALAAAVRKQGGNSYPGQFFIQANYLHPCSAGLGGKGVGNVALIFPQGKSRDDTMFYLVLHELGHSLYGPHAPLENGAAPSFHDEASAYRCIMAGPEDLDAQPYGGGKSARTFCGKCNAGLRGMLVMEEPIFTAQQQSVGGAPKPGKSGVARRLPIGSPTGGVTLPLGLPDPHLNLTPVTLRDQDDQIVLPPPIDDDDVECAIDFIPQTKANWCWAASSLIVRKYTGGEVITQQEVVTNALGHDGTTRSDDVEHSLVLEGLNVMKGEGVSLSFDDIMSEIDDDHPFIVAKTNHYLVCYGYSTKGGQALLCWDPMPVGTGAKRRLSYGDYKRLIETEVHVEEFGNQKGATYRGIVKK